MWSLLVWLECSDPDHHELLIAALRRYRVDFVMQAVGSYDVNLFIKCLRTLAGRI